MGLRRLCVYRLHCNDYILLCINTRKNIAVCLGIFSCAFMPAEVTYLWQTKTIFQILPRFLRWSSIITELIMKILPTLPITARLAINSRRATRLQSALRVTGETDSCKLASSSVGTVAFPDMAS